MRADLVHARTGGLTRPARRGWLPGVVLVAGTVMLGVLLIARPTQDQVLPRLLASAPPAPAPVAATAAPTPSASPGFSRPAGRVTWVPVGPPPRVARPAWEARRPVARATADPGRPVVRVATATSRSLPRPAALHRSRAPRESVQAP